ncbi:hypothetical protein DYB25_012252 [Aphanomyces astaci]|uniref:glutathione gamma-glutamylcysteinyltransferase n=1 Tax=Aphanomyces astaci TaxID=112090 RepID=A0A396ZSH0_APHAT|nr:hypothetical protein DYB25_012252 [Aphanomyces astaci]RHY70840.1 hypothetical protein DYB38_011436 [Aphanomyces astaci]RHY94876.1 hypothetical protein DYB26_009597 [Aphanomyces astaci]RHZ01009.1 hypothetical protein DYB31_012611 [Aphanomyces astaci]
MSLTYADPKHSVTGATKRSLVASILLFPVRIAEGVLLVVLSIVIGVPVLVYLHLFKPDVVTSALTPASLRSIQQTQGHVHFKDPVLLQRAWALPTGQLYLQGQLEFQRREGYCAPTTLRNVLKSIPSVPLELIPEAKAGPLTAQQFKTKLDAIGHTTSTLVYGGAGYDLFLAAIKRSNDPDYRVAINFLHPALFGMDGPSFLPHVMLLAILGGHFSNIIAYLETEDLVVVFDVNEDFGPYLVPSKRVYDAVRAIDIQSGVARALVVSELVHKPRQV